MQNNVPQISVILPAYNAEKYIEEAMRSVLLQTFRDYELIVIDDGSTDRTYEIVTSLAENDKRIRLVSRENRGLVSSLNEGLELAKAPLIARMDADDIALPERFSEQVNYLNSHSDIACVGTAQIIIDEDGDELTKLSVPTDNSVIQKRLLEGHCPLEHPSVMFRAELVNKIGGYRKEYETAEDYDLWLRLSEIGKLANINKPLLKYRYLNSSISAANQEKQKSMTLKACYEAWGRRGIKGQISATDEWRSSESSNSRFKFYMKFGWWAFNHKNRKAAMKYAKRSIRLKPFAFGGWNLLLNAFIKLKDTHE